MEAELNRYAKEIYDFAIKMPDEAIFPEALLQCLDDDWVTEFPSATEASFYRTNPAYLEYLLGKLGDCSGKTLESVSHYLMSCMAGCRARQRQ